jgi:hypothetical protein
MSISREDSMYHAKFTLFSLLTLVYCVSHRVWAIDEFGDIKTIKTLPLTTLDVERAFERSVADACEQLPNGEPLEVRKFMTYLTQRDRNHNKTSPKPSARHHLFTVGLEFTSEDRAALPTLSSSTIASYVEENFVTVQARVRKDYLDHKLYLHHRPLALTAKFAHAATTQSFEPIIAANIKDFHGIGMFVKDARTLRAEKLRTMVMVFKNKILRPGSNRPSDQFEFAFVRAREGKTNDRLDLHTFVTSNNRDRLHYMQAYTQPTGQNGCGILGRIAVTKYDGTGMYPTTSATRSFKIDSRTQILMSAVEEFCRRNQIPGGMSENLDVVLDAIIDGKLAGKTSELSTR